MRFQNALAFLPCLIQLSSSIALPDHAVQARDLQLVPRGAKVFYYEYPWMDITARKPRNRVWPYKEHREFCEAEYSFTEERLRSAILLPPNFSFGKKQPVLLVPGTGVSGITAYYQNYFKLLLENPSFEPVMMQIPDDSITDCQDTAEFVAYAINYISGVSGRNLSVISWSQGSLNTQWALKYWPSTREVVNDFIPISADLKGTTVSDDFDWIIKAFNLNLPASLWQQADNSTFIATLRSNGGDSAYVPTTSIYTGDDSVAIPQTSDSRATGYFNDKRKVGVTNVQIQAVCPNQPASKSVGHSGLLYNSLAYALVIDALTHPGPANVSRINLNKVCASASAPGLEGIDRENVNMYKVAIDLYIRACKENLVVPEEPPITTYAVQPRLEAGAEGNLPGCNFLHDT